MKTFLVLLLAFISFNSKANTYFFSSTDGDDTRSATQAQNSLTPWKTIDKFNTIFNTLSPGDVVLFKRGDTFYGSLQISRSGTTSLPITIGAYGVGAKPIITGLQPITNWVAIGGGIYEKSIGQTDINLVTFQDTLQPIGRWPKVTAPGNGYLYLQSHSGTSSITSNQISSAPNFTGGEVVVRKYGWILDRGRITNQTSNTVSYTAFISPDSPTFTYTPQDGFGFFFQNHINTLTQLGDWMYDFSSKKLKMYFGGNNPSLYNVQTSSIENLAFMVSKSNITFDNLSFRGANSNIFLIDNCSGISITNCNLDLAGIDAISTGYTTISNNITIQNCSITNSNNNAISVNGAPNLLIQNNTIRNTGVNRGMGVSGDGQYIGIFHPGSKSLVQFNIVKNTGYNGIDFTGDSVTVKNNFIDSFCTIKSDGGGIYTSAETNRKGRKIIGNIVTNGIGDRNGRLQSEISDFRAGNVHGIYMDGGATEVEITDNSVANCASSGLELSSPVNMLITNNTFFNNIYTQILYFESYGPISNLTFKNNIAFALQPDQLISLIYSVGNNTSSWGVLDNNYYCRPLNEPANVDTAGYPHSGTYFEYTAGGIIQAYNGRFYSLDKWKNLSGQDAHTQKTPIPVTDVNNIRFEYNPTNSIKSIVLNTTYVDVKNQVYSGTINLLPYTSLILLRSGATLLNQTINFPGLSNKLSNDAPFTISATASSGLPVSFRIVSGPASISGNTVTLTGTGVVVVEASQPGNAFYNPAPLITQSFNVSLSNQNINFPALSNKLVGDVPFNISATASSALPVSFRIVSGPATISSNIITLSGTAGTVVVEASQAGNANYNPAPVVTQSFLVASQAVDNIPPTIIPKDITIQTDALGQATIQPGDVIVSITDNSGVNNSSIHVSQTQFSCNSTPTSTHQAYIATTTTGTQNFGGELGLEFKVNNASGITISQLGAFDHQGNGITGTQSGGIRVAIFNKATQTIVPGLDAIIIGNADSYSGNYRMKNITPVTIMPGDYLVVTKGYNANELNGNSGGGTPFAPGDLGSGAISYANSCWYGSTGAGFNYPTNPDGPPGNKYLAGTFIYSTGTSTPAPTIYQAYKATTTTGTQSFGGELGLEFKVNNASGITISQLGAFDHQGNGITGTQSGGIRVAIFNKATQTIVPGLDAIIIGNADSYSGNYRMKNITPVTIMPGDYLVVTKGYNANELNGNSGGGTPFAPGDLGGGAISYANSSWYGSTGAGFNYPTNPDAPGNKYLAGTFIYSTGASTPAPTIYQAYKATTTTGTQNFGGELGLEFKVNNASGISISQLGTFDHQGNGITGTQSGGIRVAIFNKATQTIVPGLDAIIIGNADSYSSNYRMKNITPVTIMPGDYLVVTKGYNANELNGNSGGGTPFAPGDLGGGAISFANSCWYGSTGAAFNYPTNPDAPGNKYLAGTFSYSTGTSAPINNTYAVTITASDIYGNIGQATANVTLVCNQTTSTSTSTMRTIQTPAVDQQGLSILNNEPLNISKGTFNIFPNPTNGQFSVQLLNVKAPTVTIQILTEEGMLVTQRSLNVNGSAILKTDFNLKGKASGIYIIKVIGVEGIKNRKLILLR